MDMKRLLRRSSSLMLMLMLTAGMLMAGVQETNAASSGKLVKSVKNYYKTGSKWKLSSTTTYKYNKKGDPVSFSINSKGRNAYKARYTIAYTYVQGKKTEAVEYLQEYDLKKNRIKKIFYDSKGRPQKAEIYEPGYPDKIMRTEQYIYGKNGYITRINGTYGDTVIDYKWNGKRAKAFREFLLRDNSKTKIAQIKFNKKGFIEKPKWYTQADPAMTYTYKTKKGLVRTVNLEMREGYNRYYEKNIISYTKRSIDKKRYRNMINAVIEGDSPEATGTYWY